MPDRAKLLTTTIALVACLLFAPLAVEAQQAGKVHKIGYLSHREPKQERRNISAFKQGLQELGYVEGKNIVIEALYANMERNRLPALAAELLRRKVDIIITGGSTSTLTVQRLSKTIPSITWTVIR